MFQHELQIFNYMTYQASTAYVCVALRIMTHKGSEITEEYPGILMGMLYDFYTAGEIQKIHSHDIIFDSYDAVINDMSSNFAHRF